MKIPNQNRRNFLKTSSAGIVGAGLIGKNPYSSTEDDQDIPRIKEYSTFGRTGFKISDIGFGMPKNPAIIKAAVMAGVNFLDSARNYSNSETDIGKVIGDLDRESLFISTKIHARNFQWLETKEQMLNFVRESMERLKVDYLDSFMLQAATSCNMVKNEIYHGACEQLIQEGKLKHRGIACHGSYFPGNPEDSMENILLCAIEDGRFDLLLVVYNFLYPEEGGIVLKEAKKKNIGTLVMKSNPVSMYQFMLDYADKMEEGEEIPERYKKTFEEFEQHNKDAFAYLEENGIESSDKQLRDVATRFVLENPDADCVLTRFETFEDLEVHVGLSGTKLSAQNRQNLEIYKQALNPLYCRHGCSLCESSCPHSILVNTIMRYNYYYAVKGNEKEAMEKYSGLCNNKRFGPGIPDVCMDCPGFCANACPYGVNIQPMLFLAHQNLSFKNPGSGMS